MRNYYLFTPSKKVFLFGLFLVSIAAFSSCSGDSIIEDGVLKGENVTTFTATIEGESETRTTLDEGTTAGNKKVNWESTDKVNINGATYSVTPGTPATTATLSYVSGTAPQSPFKAIYPASLYNNGNYELPATQTYTAGQFNAPMYAESADSELAFKNICSVLAIKVTNGDIATLKSIKVKSDKAMCGEFTVAEATTGQGDYKAMLTNADDATKVVTLTSAQALTLTEEGTTFYITIPAQDYQYLTIFLSADGTTYKEAMATKVPQPASGAPISIARNTILPIDYAMNAVQLWDGSPYFATYNVGATSVSEYGGYYSWASGVDTATNLWGTAWQMPTKENFSDLVSKCTYSWESNYNNTNTAGGLFTGKDGYASNSVFFPAAGSKDNSGNVITADNNNGIYWSSTAFNTDTYILLIRKDDNPWIGARDRSCGRSVRAILK